MKQSPIEIIHEDEDIIIVNKPAQFLSIPDRFRPEIPNVLSFIGQMSERMFTVHRLDKETSGIMVFAKNAEAHKNLSQQFEKRTTKKIYLAIVDGIPFEPEGLIDKPIDKHPLKKGLMVISPQGKPSQSEYKVVETFGDKAMVEVNILTGRTHQVRLHLKSIGHPIIIDEFYGRKDAFFLSTIKRGKLKLSKNEDEKPLMDRTCLHAFKLSFDHPKTGLRVTYEADVPKDFAAVIRQFRKAYHK